MLLQILLQQLLDFAAVGSRRMEVAHHPHREPPVFPSDANSRDPARNEHRLLKGNSFGQQVFLQTQTQQPAVASDTKDTLKRWEVLSSGCEPLIYSKSQ